MIVVLCSTAGLYGMFWPQAVTPQVSVTPPQGRRVIGPAAVPDPNAPMTEAEGAAILNELRQIHRLLESRQPEVTPVPGSASLSLPNSVGPVVTGNMRVEADWHGLGRSEAAVTVVEFADLQCPHCRRLLLDTFPQIKAAYIDTGKVRFVSLDLPLARHVFAMPAAEADRCAGEQGKFWQFRDAILIDQTPATSKEIMLQAGRLGLSLARFENCLRSHRYQSAIEQDERDAAALHIAGTPSFFIGRVTGGWLQGIELVGALPYSAYQEIIDRALATATSSLTSQHRTSASVHAPLRRPAQPDRSSAENNGEYTIPDRK